jgi:serine/threonine protein kinase/formylglycine-generating enzyme required for sulfatase activity
VLEEATWTPPGEFDEYRIVRPLGRGSMGQVFLAQDLVLDRPVAVKFLGSFRPDPVERERFLVEARAVARIQHPNVMGIYRVGEIQGRLYLVSEYIRGQSLGDLELPLPWAKVLEIGIGLARGLGAAHRQGVLHRDIKLSNALIDEFGQVKLLDFGLAKLVDVPGDRTIASSSASSTQRGIVPETRQDLVMRAANNARHMVVQRLADTAKLEPVAGNAPTPKVQRRVDESPRFKDGWSGGAASITRQGTVMGTPHYMAPELWLADPASRRSDVYALGVLMYILCCGKPPHDADSPFDLAMLVQEKEPLPLLSLAPGVDARLAGIIDRCLERDPYQRFASAEELRSALEVVAAPQRRGGPGIPTGNPYRGLQAFEAEHRSLFFGRSAEIRAVVERLRADSFVVVAGDSGVGKSSLCRAGVVPMVNEGNLDPGKTWRTVIMTPGRYPRQSFVAVVARGFGLGEEEVSTLLKSEPEALVRALRKQLGEAGGCMIFIDQFEEFVTIAEPAEVALIGPLVVRLLAGIPGLKVMATVRGDFLTRVATVPGLGDEVTRGIFLLRPLSPEGAREAIAGPAQAHGVAFESDELVDELVEAGVKGSLPLLQFALAELWESRDTSTSVISTAELRKIGGVTGALARHADGVLAGLLPAQRAAARRLLMRLVTLDNTRASLTLEELAAAGEASKAALDALVRGRLLVVKEAGERMVYEIAHEALVGGWAQLAGWLEEEKEARAVLHRLEAAASEWERLGRGQVGLWSASQVAEAGTIEHAGLRPRESEFLVVSAREATRARRLRRALIVAVPLALLSTYGGLWVQGQRALRERVDASFREAQRRLGDAEVSARSAQQQSAAALQWFDSQAVAQGEELWAKAQAERVVAAREFAEASQAAETALSLDNSREDIRMFLADVLLERVLHLEKGVAFDGGVSRDELVARLALYDREGTRIARLKGAAHLYLTVTPPAARVAIAAYVFDEGGKARLAERRDLGVVRALEPVMVDPGSYLLTVTSEGYADLKLPVLVERDERLPVDVTMRKTDDIPPGYTYIPAGRFLFGGAGDPDLRRSFMNAVPLHQVSTGSYLIATHEATFADYMEFLEGSDEELRQKHMPRTLRREGPGAWVLSWDRDAPYEVASGQLFTYPGGGHLTPGVWERYPVVGITAVDALAYVGWLDGSGRLPGARLCTDYEWERAARGADSRFYPHGNTVAPNEANFDRTYGQDPRLMGLDEVGAYPASTSPYGVLDMAGNAFEWVSSSLQPSSYVARGGGFAMDALQMRVMSRETLDAGYRSEFVGVRVCATLSH